MSKIKYGNESFEYELIKKKKKNISITVKPGGEVVVTAPYGLEDKLVQEVVYKKSKWILDKLKAIGNIDETKEKKYENGERIKYLGSEYFLKVIEGNFESYGVRIDGENLIVYINGELDKSKRQELTKEILKAWLKEQARIKFRERTKFYGDILKLIPNRITIKDQKTRWGSCSSRRNINYNWRLIMAPLSILDYVVVHELCHLEHMNHSKEFWNLVKEITPDYKEKREWLKNNGKELNV